MSLLDKECILSLMFDLNKILQDILMGKMILYLRKMTRGDMLCTIKGQIDGNLLQTFHCCRNWVIENQPDKMLPVGNSGKH